MPNNKKSESSSGQIESRSATDDNRSASRSSNQASSQPRGLGFDPDEPTDLTMPDTIDFNERPDLVQWQYLEGGQRLPLFFKNVPHLHDKQPAAKKVIADMETQELCIKIAREARQAQLESVTLKQKADTLQSEKELLQWHIANNSKKSQLQAGLALTGVQKLAKIQEKAAVVEKDAEAAELLNNSLIIEVEKMEKEFTKIQQELEDEESAYNEVLSQKHNYLADITLERRIADHERILRHRQWQKLARAANVDKKHHVKYDLSTNLDYMIFDAYNQVKAFKELDIAACDDVIGKARSNFRQEVEEVDPLEDFMTSENAGSSQREGNRASPEVSSASNDMA